MEEGIWEITGDGERLDSVLWNCAPVFLTSIMPISLIKRGKIQIKESLQVIKSMHIRIFL